MKLWKKVTSALLVIYMQGMYIELPCDYYTMLTFMVCYRVCLYM